MTMTASDQKQSFSSLSGLQSFMHSLQRLVKIGLYYPEGHDVLTRATTDFQQKLRKVARENSSIRFSLRNEQLFLENVELPSANPFVEELACILANLGIDELEIDREIEAGEITSFLLSMLQRHAQALSTYGFQQIEFVELPLSVRITRKEFLTTQPAKAPDPGIPASPDQPTLEQFMERLHRQGVDRDQLSRCRAVMESLAAKDLSELQQQSGMPQVDWHDLEQLLIQITREENQAAGRGINPTVGNLNSLASVLQALEKHTSTKRSKEAIRLLVSVVRGSLAGKQTERSGKSGDKNTRSGPSLLPVAQLETFIQQQHPGKTRLKWMFVPDRREELGILMLLLKKGHSLDIEARLYQALRDILSSRLQPQEWEILIQGTKHFLDHVDQAKLTSVLRMILPPLRRSEHTSSLALFNRIMPECNPLELRKIWPHAVNELLRLGGRNAPEQFRQLCEQVSSLPRQEVRTLLPLLKELDSFKDKIVASDVCEQLPPQSYPFFGMLLTTSLQSQLLARIIHSFSVHPPERVMESTLPFLDRKNPLHVEFFTTYLQQSRPEALVSPDAALLAGRIITDSLSSLPRERRSELHVLRGISVLSSLPAENGRETLESIVDARRWLVIPEWPASCRKEATVSLRRLKRTRSNRTRLR